MDTGLGQFKTIDPTKFNEQMQLTEPKVFQVGEIFFLRGSRFRIEKINKKGMILKLLPELTELHDT